MKIGLVCPYNMFLGGGVQEVVIALREGLVKRGHEAYIITPRPANYDGDPPEGMLLVGGARPIRAARTRSQISASVDTDSLEEMLNSYNFDVLHFHEPWTPMLSRQILLRSNAINIATFHAAMSERRTSRTVEKVITPYTKSILKYLDILTAVSPAATNYAKTLTNRKILIVPNGIDLKKYKYRRIKKGSEDSKTIFYIGRLEKRKAVKYLIAAYAELLIKRPNTKLIIAGDGVDREKLEDYVREHKIPGVSFLGHISEEDKLKYMQESDIFCSPALYGESFGIVLLEAMASGCVTVAGNNAGYEAVLDGTGQLSVVNPIDTVEFARRLFLLIDNEQLRSEWIDWALDEVKKYDYEKVIDMYMKIYQMAYDKKLQKT